MLSNDIIWNEIKNIQTQYKDEVINGVSDKMFKLFMETIRYNYSCALPTIECINEIVKFVKNDSILEIGAGKGLWVIF